MKHSFLSEETAADIALQALGVQDPASAEAFEAHLPECTVCGQELRQVQDALALLGASLPAACPSPELKSRLMERVRRSLAEERAAAPARDAINFDRLRWEPSETEGVGIHLLRRDPETGTLVALIRMAPGCGFPSHTHADGEECFVLQGRFRDGSGEYGAGDFVHYSAGSRHRAIEALPGPDCVVLVVSHGGIRP